MIKKNLFTYKIYSQKCIIIGVEQENFSRLVSIQILVFAI